MIIIFCINIPIHLIFTPKESQSGHLNDGCIVYHCKHCTKGVPKVHVFKKSICCKLECSLNFV